MPDVVVEEGMELVEEEDVLRKLFRKMVMCRCGGVMSLDMGRVATLALLPC